MLDVKGRLAPRIAEQRFGFLPSNIAVLLIFPDDRNARRIAARFGTTISAAFPARNEVRRWLRSPSGNLRGLWFVTKVDVDRPTSRHRAVSRSDPLRKHPFLRQK